MSGKIYIVDVTNRDGVQTARLSLSKFQKTMVNYYLGKMGIWASEFGFPMVSHERNYMRANLALREKGAFGDLVLAGWCPAKPEHVEIALSRVPLKYMNLSVSTSTIMTKGKFGGRMNRDDIINMMTAAVHTAKGGGVEQICVNAEDASRTDERPDEDYLVRFAKAAKEHGARRIRYCDTLGYDRTTSIYENVRRLASEVELPIEIHCHNDLGYAVANSIEGAVTAVETGVDAYINVTVNGMGERAGNADMVSVLLALTKSRGLRHSDILAPGVDMSMSWTICNYVAYAFGLPIPVNQVGVGANAFAHESGIHADGVLKDRHNYELYDFEELGRGGIEETHTGRIITTGEYGGVKGFRHVCEQYGIEVGNELLVFELAQRANAHNQKPLTRDELWFINEYPEEVKLLLTSPPWD